MQAIKATSGYIKNFAFTLLCAVACILASGCGSVIYDGEQPCDVSYKVTFRYDMNMKWADAFANEVTSIRLYAFDRNGTLVWEKEETGEALARPGYSMKLPLKAGDYTLIAWGGLNNATKASDRTESFEAADLLPGNSAMEQLYVHINKKETPAGNYSDEPLFPLFHGKLEVSLPEWDAKSANDHTYNMPLVKNTNHVRIILQHLSGEAVNVDDFNFVIDSDNGVMDHDNNLVKENRVHYLPHSLTTGSAGYDPVDGSSQPGLPGSRPPVVSVNVAIADLTVGRLMAGEKATLTVTKAKNGEIAARIPLTDYALLLKNGYGRQMTDQEFLDRQDEYALTFFLDERDNWINTSIIINSWKIVLDNINFD